MYIVPTLLWTSSSSSDSGGGGVLRLRIVNINFRSELGFEYYLHWDSSANCHDRMREHFDCSEVTFLEHLSGPSPLPGCKPYELPSSWHSDAEYYYKYDASDRYEAFYL